MPVLRPSRVGNPTPRDLTDLDQEHILEEEAVDRKLAQLEEAREKAKASRLQRRHEAFERKWDALRRRLHLRHYHRRSNVESVFSSVKRKFGDAVRSKTPVAMKNEVLAKLVCHNLSQLIHLMYEIGIKVNFESEPEIDSKMILKFPF